MKKQILFGAIALTVLLAMTGSAFAGTQPPPVPDGGTTSFLLAGAVGVLCFARRFVR